MDHVISFGAMLKLIRNQVSISSVLNSENSGSLCVIYSSSCSSCPSCYITLRYIFFKRIC